MSTWMKISWMNYIPGELKNLQTKIHELHFVNFGISQDSENTTYHINFLYL